MAAAVHAFQLRPTRGGAPHIFRRDSAALSLSYMAELYVATTARTSTYRYCIGHWHAEDIRHNNVSSLY